MTAKPLGNLEHIYASYHLQFTTYHLQNALPLGHTNGDVLDHVVQIHGTRYVETDADMVATGKLLDVKGSACDFTSPKAIRKDIDAFKGDMSLMEGYDHCFLIDEQLAPKQTDNTRLCAVCMQLFETKTCIQICLLSIFLSFISLNPQKISSEPNFRHF